MHILLDLVRFHSFVVNACQVQGALQVGPEIMEITRRNCCGPTGCGQHADTRVAPPRGVSQAAGGTQSALVLLPFFFFFFFSCIFRIVKFTL